MSVDADLLNDSAWEKISSEAELDFLKVGDELVRSTLALGHGADLRATTIMGMFGTTGVALLAAVATLFVAERPYWPLIGGGATIALGLFVATGFCAAGAWPRNFFVAGFEPRNLLHSGAIDDRYRVRILVAVTQDRIDHNRRSIDRAAKFLMRGICVAGLSLLLGVASFGILYVTAYHPGGMGYPPASARARAPVGQVPPEVEKGPGPAFVHRPY